MIHLLPAFIQNINGPEILLIFLIVLLLFGAKRLPELFRSFGKSLKEFKKATSDIEDDIRTAMDTDEGTERKQSSTSSTASNGSEQTSRNESEQAASQTEKKETTQS